MFYFRNFVYIYFFFFCNRIKFWGPKSSKQGGAFMLKNFGYDMSNFHLLLVA